jgi:hypothetical protein
MDFVIFLGCASVLGLRYAFAALKVTGSKASSS